MPHTLRSSIKLGWYLNHHLPANNSLLKIAEKKGNLLSVPCNKGDDYIFSCQQCHMTDRVTRRDKDKLFA